MRIAKVLAKMALGVATLVALPVLAEAQSAFTGAVRDSSGAVLPGVTVEAQSPVLIEGVRSVITNDAGLYRLVDLRPGTYVLTFSLPGFKQVRLANLELRSEFTAQVNATLEVGAIEEAVTVTSEAPLVDVSSTAKSTVITREILDQVPTGRTIQAIGQLVAGISLNVPDVGGSRAMQQSYMSTRGLTSANNIVTVDGLMVNGLDGDGAVQQYFNQTFVEEMTYQTSGANADVSPGGVRMNIIPRDGGNRFNGSFFGSYTDGAWQAANLDDDLRARGLRAAGGIDRIYDFSVGQGGPIKRDKLWFFGSARAWSVDAPIADTFIRPAGATQADCQTGRVSCEQGIDDQKIKSALLRLTWQASPKHKFAAYYDEIDKFRGHGMNAGDDVLTASQIWTSPKYNSAAAKYTGSISSRLLIEGGYSFNYEQYVITNQPGVNKEVFTPEWFGGASRQDLDLGTRTSGLASWGGRYPDRFAMAGSVSYITGAHNLKVGMQRTWGIYENTRETNGDLNQLYRSGVPSQVGIYNTPLRYRDRLKNDIGVYAQDSWAIKRLTLNLGLRWEYLAHEVSEASSGAGRFVPERNFAAIPMPTWKDVAPRLGMAYDLFGNGKTAIKAGFNRYNESRTTLFANRYNPLAISSSLLAWTDLNGNDIADGPFRCTYLTAGCEINYGQLPANFGVRALDRVDPDFQRTYNLETTAGVQHQLLPGLSVSATWYRRTFYDLLIKDNQLITQADYTPFDVVSPLDGSVITAYNLNPAKLTAVDNLDRNASSDREQIYNGVDFTFNARIKGATMFGGFTTERTLRVTCDEPDNPNLLLFCDDRSNGIPYRPQLKLAGTAPVGWGVTVSASLQSLAGRPIGGFSTTGIFANKISGPGYGDVGSPAGTQWLITRTTRYAANCPGPCRPGELVAPNLSTASLTLPLVPQGTEFLPRINQLDLSLAKSFQVRGLRIQGQLDMFNFLNANPELGYRGVNFGTAAYLQPDGILNGRTIRLGTQLRW